MGESHVVGLRLVLLLPYLPALMSFRSILLRTAADKGKSTISQENMSLRTSPAPPNAPP
jgi:hypothetical protein